MANEWEYELRNNLKRKAKTINYRDPNRYDYRTGTLGSESSYQGFRSAVLYFQLSPLIDREVVKKAIGIIARNMGPRHKNRFATLFLNSEKLQLIYPRKMLNDSDAVIEVVNDYYDRLADSCLPFGGTLQSLFPPVSLYASYYPGHQDVFVLFQTSNRVKINPDLERNLRPTRNNWICITCEKNIPVEISPKMPEIMDAAQP